MKQLSLAKALIAGLVFLSHTGLAQPQFNPGYSNYGGLHSASWNPASLADNRYSVQLQLFGVDRHIANSAFQYTGNWSLRAPDTDLRLTTDVLSPRSTNQYSLFSTGFQARGPGVLVRLSPKHTIAFSSRVRRTFQGNNISQAFFQQVVDGFQTWGRSTNNNFSVNLNAFSEWNASYARVVFEQESHFLKAGFTVKRLSGIGTAYLHARDLSYSVGPKFQGDTSLQVQGATVSFGYANPEAFQGEDVEDIARWLLPQQAAGRGWGADIGLVYEFRPVNVNYHYTDKKGREKTDYSRNKYRFRLALSLTDLGSISYRNQATVFNEIQIRNLGISNADANGIKLSDFAPRINQALRTSRLTPQNQLKSRLPTALNFDADYKAYGSLYVNLAISHGLLGEQVIGMRSFSYAMLTPRLETRIIEVAMPLSLVNNYQQVAYGAMLRVGPVSVGSNDLSALFSSSNPHSANAYAQVSLLNWANKRPPRVLRDKAKAPPSLVPTGTE